VQAAQLDLHFSKILQAKYQVQFLLCSIRYKSIYIYNLLAIAGVAKTLKQIEEDHNDTNEELGHRYGNASPLFTPRTFKEIRENSSESNSTVEHKKTNASRNKIKLILVNKFNNLRLALCSIPISHTLQTNDMVTVLKLSDLVIRFLFHV